MAFLADLPDFDFPPVFFFVVFALEEGDGVLVGFADGDFRGVLSSSSASSLAVDADLAVFAGDFFGLGVAESSVSDFALEGVFAGLGEAAFFFLGEAVAVGEGDFACTRGVASPLGDSSSLTWPWRREAIRAIEARAVAMQRRKRATAAHRNRVGGSFKPPAEREDEIVLLWHVPVRDARLR